MNSGLTNKLQLKFFSKNNTREDGLPIYQFLKFDLNTPVVIAFQYLSL